jgi:hypothetical protein
MSEVLDKHKISNEIVIVHVSCIGPIHCLSEIELDSVSKL